jgi:hypothetical protein
VASSYLSAILLLALGAWVHPALSATGAGARCDQSVDTPPISADADSKLAIQVIDHGTSTSVADPEISVDDAFSDPVPQSSSLQTERAADDMLRQIFGEARTLEPSLSETGLIEDLGAPLAVDKAEAMEEPTAVLETDQADVAAELPGFSEDELLRYRQKMYRKDI